VKRKERMKRKEIVKRKETKKRKETMKRNKTMTRKETMKRKDTIKRKETMKRKETIPISSPAASARGSASRIACRPASSSPGALLPIYYFPAKISRINKSGEKVNRQKIAENQAAEKLRSGVGKRKSRQKVGK
jgi:hypothetical protein